VLNVPSFFQMTHDLSTEIEALDGDVLPHESCHDYSKGVFQIRTNFTPEIFLCLTVFISTYENKLQYRATT